MKNILIQISLVLFLTSCAGKFVEVRLFTIDKAKQGSAKNYYEERFKNPANNVLFDNVMVLDHRNNQELIGIKEYGEEAIEIINNQDLANLIKGRIVKNLLEDNLVINQDKTLKVTLETLKYSSKRGFLMGKAKVKISLKVQLVANDTNYSEYDRTYNIANERPHFIISLTKTDQKTISSALKRAINKVTEDGSLINALINQDNDDGEDDSKELLSSQVSKNIQSNEGEEDSEDNQDNENENGQ